MTAGTHRPRCCTHPCQRSLSPSALNPAVRATPTLITLPSSLTLRLSTSSHGWRHGPPSSGRSRKLSTIRSNCPPIRDTRPLRHVPCAFAGSCPVRGSGSSTLPVDTPSAYARWVTAAGARPPRLRGLGRPGKQLPSLSLGMRSPIAPSRVSHGRGRYPLRWVSRSALRSPHSGPRRDPGTHDGLHKHPERLRERVVVAPSTPLLRNSYRRSMPSLPIIVLLTSHLPCLQPMAGMTRWLVSIQSSPTPRARLPLIQTEGRPTAIAHNVPPPRGTAHDIGIH